MASISCVSTKPPKGKVWTLAEESKLVTLVVANEDLLYGNYKGAGVEKITKLRNRKWAEIANTINTQFSVDVRSGSQCRKKYANTKLRSLGKVSEMRHPGTGGGPGPDELTSAENALVTHLEDRAILSGIPGAMDSEAPLTTTTTAPLTGESEHIEATNDTVEVLPSGSEAIPAAIQPFKRSSHAPLSGCAKRKKREEEDDLSTKILKADLERLKAETIKIKAETNFIHNRNNYILVKTKYYNNRILSEFSAGSVGMDQFFQMGNGSEQ